MVVSIRVYDRRVHFWHGHGPRLAKMPENGVHREAYLAQKTDEPPVSAAVYRGRKRICRQLVRSQWDRVHAGQVVLLEFTTSNA